MKRFFLAIITTIFASAGVASQDLAEFSTSMDFDEFEVVLKHLRTVDAPLADEIDADVREFKNSSSVGQSKKYTFKRIPGYLVLDREDEYAIGIATYTSVGVQTEIEAAYEKGTQELGI